MSRAETATSFESCASSPPTFDRPEFGNRSPTRWAIEKAVSTIFAESSVRYMRASYRQGLGERTLWNDTEIQQPNPGAPGHVLMTRAHAARSRVVSTRPGAP